MVYTKIVEKIPNELTTFFLELWIFTRILEYYVSNFPSIPLSLSLFYLRTFLTDQRIFFYSLQ